MTDSEKLDLLLAEMQEMKTEVKEINHRVAQLEAGQTELKKKVDRLAVEETNTRRTVQN